MSELRNQSLAKHRVNHIGSERYYWQRKFSSWIRRELGIEPLRSCRLDHTADRETNGVAELIQGLGNNQTWRSSSQALVRIGMSAVPALISALGNRDPRIRFRAINTLDEMGRLAEEAIPILLELRIFDRIDYVREQADSVLRRHQHLS